MKRIITALIFLICCNCSFAQAGRHSLLIKKMERYLSALEEVGFSGTVLVELGGKKVISKGYGYADKDHRIKNDPATISSTGSLTKQFTATAILKLEMQNKLSTSDKLSKYFIGVPSDKANITIHDLLRHQSGLPSNVGGDFEKTSEKDFISAVLHAPLLFPSGTKFAYSNIGYSLLGIIIEKVSGKSYETYLYENLWQPAGMEMTGYSRPKFDTSKIAVGYYRDGKVWGKFTNMNWNGNAPYWHLKANGGVLSTTEDLYKWRKALATDKLLTKEARHKLYFPELRASENDNPYYAYGWDMLKTERNTFRSWHNGTNNIIYADYMCFLDEGITLIMLSNQSNQNFDRLNFELAKLIFQPGYQPVIPIAENETNRNLTEQVIAAILSGGLETGKIVYNKRAKKTDLLESTVNAKGYALMAEKKYDDAIAVFSMNCYAFPKSANAFDSLGEAFMNKGDKASAIKYYTRSMELDPGNRNAEDMLKQLK